MAAKYQIINPERGQFVVQQYVYDKWTDMYSNRLDGIGVLRAVYSSQRDAMNFIRNHILNLNWVPELPQQFDENGEPVK